MAAQKTPDVGERLWRSLLSMGRRDEAMTVAEEAYDKLGQPGFLVDGGRPGRQVRRLGAEPGAVREGRRQGTACSTRRACFWFQRAQLAVQDERAGDAEKYFQRVLAIDPRSEDAHSNG